MSDLHRLRTAWARLDTSPASSIAAPARNAAGSLRKRLRPLAFGQGTQVLLGVGLLALGAVVRSSAETSLLQDAATAIGAYGIAAIGWALATLALLLRVDFAGPVAQAQRQVLRLQQVQLLGSLVLGLAWWVLWIPLMLVLFAWAGGDYLAHVGPALRFIVAACAAGLLASLVLGALAWRHPTGRRLLRRSLLGERLHALGEALDQMAK